MIMKNTVYPKLWGLVKTIYRGEFMVFKYLGQGRRAGD